MVILVPVGHLLPSSEEGETIKTFSKGSDVPDLDSQDWPSLVEQARQQVIECMEARLGISGLRGKIIWEEVNTPETCEHLTIGLSHPSNAEKAIREGEVQSHSWQYSRYHP